MRTIKVWLLVTLLSLLGPGLSPATAQDAPAQPSKATTATMRVPPPPDDIRILVNGQDVTGSRNIRLKNVSIRFDTHGNLHVDAPRYQLKLQPGVGRRKVKLAETKAAVPGAQPAVSTLTTPAIDIKPVHIPPSMRYFASIIANHPSVLGCRISVLVDGNEVASFNGQEAHLFVEITAKISRGEHALEFRCRRPPAAQPNLEEIEPNMLRDAFLEIHVGPGVINGPMVELHSILGKIRCTDRTGGRTESKAQIIVE